MRRDDVIRVLGPIDLLLDGTARSAGGRNARRLLGALAVGAGRSVSADRLVWSIWGDDPPPSATGSLQTYIGRLRHLLGSDTIARSDHSYRLVVERHQVDAIRFEDLLVRAGDQRDDPEACRATCIAALALWRGDPFGDFVDDEPFHLESARLSALRLAAMELELDCELTLGHPEIVAAELESAVEEHPHRERLWYLLIEALRLDDRRIDALHACRRLRTALEADGLQAGDHLDELERVILGTPHADRDRSTHGT
jgi:DNA-binding SARP family transcriptional activator